MNCITPGCKTEVLARGLCEAHYRALRRAITLDKVSEEDLVSKGLMLPSQAVSPLRAQARKIRK